MVTYVQIGKKPRMAINDTIANIRTDFIKQIPSWKSFAPIYFYSSAKSKYYKGVLLPYKWKYSTMKDYACSFYWIGESEYWSVNEHWKSKVKYGTVGWNKLMDTIEKYREKGYEL